MAAYYEQYNYTYWCTNTQLRVLQIVYILTECDSREKGEENRQLVNDTRQLQTHITM